MSANANEDKAKAVSHVRHGAEDKAEALSHVLVEPERYELEDGVSYRFELNRRDLLKLTGGGFVVAVLLTRSGMAQESGRAGGRDRSAPEELSAWLAIDERGHVTVFTGKTEIGQNIRTSLTQAVADEVAVRPDTVTLLMADTAKTPFDMGTFGSRTTPHMAPQLRRAAAAAKRALAARAAAKWHVDAASLECRDGVVRDAAHGRSATYGELAASEQPLTGSVADAPAPADRAGWRLAGTAAHKVDGRAFVTGRHAYPYDTQRPGMMYGLVIRPPSFGATPASVDVTPAQAIPGVRVVHDGNFIGVAAENRARARRAASLVRVQWQPTENVSSAGLLEHFRTTAQTTDASAVVHAVGSIEEGRKRAAHAIDASYTVAYIAHVPLEPRAAVAEWSGDRVTVWTGTQRPFGVQGELAEAFRLPPERVRVIVPDVGSAYGGKHTGEVAIEAARLARAAGRPVKVAWTREEEFSWAYFRPAGIIDLTGGVTADGRLAFWSFENYNSGAAAIRTPYDVPHQRIAFYRTDSPLRQGSYRGLAATANQFARESHIDALAEAARADAVEFRLRHLPDPRLKAVLQAAADRIRWGSPQDGESLGIACGFEKGGYIATAVALRVDKGVVQLRKIVTAFDCGAVVNPDGLKNQVEGALVQGLGGALFEAVEFKGGRITNGTLAAYRVPRFSDVPPIDVLIVEPKGAPSAGAGETPLIALAPAIANALYRATGTRLRSLPLLSPESGLTLERGTGR